MKILNMDHFVITVNNLDKAKDFYHRIIGLKIVNQQSNQDFVTMMCGGYSLFRLRKSTNEVNAIVAKHLSTGSFDFCLESSNNVQEIIKNFETNNIQIELGPVVKHGFKGKMMSVYVRDPDGNLVEISTYHN